MNYKARSTEKVPEGQYPVFECNVDAKHKGRAQKLAGKLKGKPNVKEDSNAS